MGVLLLKSEKDLYMTFTNISAKWFDCEQVPLD